MTPIPPAVLAHLAAALNEAEMLVALYDPQDALVWANRRFAAHFLRGLPLPAAFADVVRHAFHGGFGIVVDCGDVEAFLRDILPRRRSQRYRAFASDMIDGSWVWMTETLLDNGWLLSVASEITSLKHHEQRLAEAHDHAFRAARTDELTQASNRRHILEVAHAALQASAAATLVMVDLDNFKAINDRLGHAVGDAVLQHFVRHCQSHLRPGDHLGRLGGEEFLLVLQQAGEAAADAVVARLRVTLPPLDGLRYDFSAGITCARPGDSVERALARADTALYAAKHSGKGRNVVAG